jgi:hypothetical protein
MGFGPPAWYFPVLLVFGLSTEDTSLGVSLPLQCSRKESPRPSPVALSGLPGGARGFISRSHLADYGAARRFSQPLSGLFLSLPSRHFQAGGTRGVVPFRELFLPRSPDDSSSPACPLDVDPIELACSRPRRERSRALEPVPRSVRLQPFCVFRAFVLVEIGLFIEPGLVIR